MSHIVEFSITGLAGRKDVYARTLDRHVNVFFGLNGSGKTSLLKILHSAMSSDPRSLRNVPFRDAEVKVYSIYYDRVFTHTISMEPTKPAKRMELEADTSELFSSFAEYLDFSSDEVLRRIVLADRELPAWTEEPDIRSEDQRGWAHRYLPTSRLYLGRRTVESKLLRSSPGALSEDWLDQYYAETLQSLWRDYYHDILAAASEAQEDGLASILKAVLSGKKQPKETLRKVDLETAYDRVAKFLQRQGSPGILGSLETFKKHYEENPQLRNVVSDINEIEKRIAEATAPRDKLQTLIQNMFAVNKTVHFRDRSIDVVTDDEEEIGLSTLSSGEKHVLRIFIETLLAEGNTILIDEPELSMHVDWQRELIATMRQLNRSAQIILATHSPEIMADVSDDRIFRL
jgi:predicted ATP-dependent endonuclease of OLD family